MKSYFYALLAAIALLFVASGCKNDTDDIEKKKPSVVSGKLVSHTGCKVLPTDPSSYSFDSQSCAEYSYNGATQRLVIKHVNAGFNCAPGDLSVKVSISNDTLIIQEFETMQAANCNCLYDLNIEIEGIDAKPYQIKFIEPYLGNQEQLIFGVDFSDQTEGTYCVTRIEYPWIGF